MVIIIVGAPGVGKTTMITALSQEWQCPNFEMSWLPEFRFKGAEPVSFEDEETVALANLSSIAINYVRFGYPVVLISDIRLDRLDDIHQLLVDVPHRFLKLVTDNEQVLADRLKNRGDENAYRDWQEAIRLNQQYQARHFPSEVEIVVTGKNIPELTRQICQRFDVS